MRYIDKISILDNKTILVSLNDNLIGIGNIINRTMSVGDHLTGGCTVINSHLQISYLTLEKITTENIPFIEFREDFVPFPGTQCSFEDLIGMKNAINDY